MIAAGLRRTGAFLPVLLFLFLLAPLSALPALAKPEGAVVVYTASGSHRFTIEWATTSAEREHGLMGRKHMAADHGMLFDFGTDQPVVFWMKDTPLPLDMVFIASDGTVRKVARRTKPFSLAMIPSDAPVRYVLEINGGISERLGITAGSKVEIEGR